MSRNPLIEAIHEARYDLETCARQERAARQKKLEDLLPRRWNAPARKPNPTNFWTPFSTITVSFAVASVAKNGLGCARVSEGHKRFFRAPLD